MLAKIEIILNEEKKIITRQCYTLNDLFGDIGGILSIYTAFLALLLTDYSKQSFIINAIRKINETKLAEANN